jgi:hypothetical protein
MNHIKNCDFTIVGEKDITDSVTKTLDIGMDFVERIYKGLEIGTEKVREKHPHISRFLLWLFKGKIEKLEKQTQLLDSAEFKKNKTYRFILLQVNSK